MTAPATIVISFRHLFAASSDWLNRMCGSLISLLWTSAGRPRHLNSLIKASCIATVFLMVQQVCCAGQLNVSNGGASFQMSWFFWPNSNAVYSQDANGYITSPDGWKYTSSVLNKQDGLRYYYLLGEYQNGHCYWAGFNEMPADWYMWRIHETQGLVVAFIIAKTDAAIDLSGDAYRLFHSLGLQEDGGPLELS